MRSHLKSASRKALENILSNVCCGKFCNEYGIFDIDQAIRDQSDLAIVTIL